MAMPPKNGFADSPRNFRLPGCCGQATCSAPEFNYSRSDLPLQTHTRAACWRAGPMSSEALKVERWVGEGIIKCAHIILSSRIYRCSRTLPARERSNWVRPSLSAPRCHWHDVFPRFHLAWVSHSPGPN